MFQSNNNFYCLENLALVHCYNNWVIYKTGKVVYDFGAMLLLNKNLNLKLWLIYRMKSYDKTKKK